MNKLGWAMALGMCITAQTASADLIVRFVEGAPKDRFVIENTGECPVVEAVLELDLSRSSGGLIFDVTGAGAGVQVFQPFVVTAGGDALASLPQVADGDRAITLTIRNLPVQAQIAFTIDVDDTRGQRASTVSGSEIDGAEIRLSSPGITAAGQFDQSATARVPLPPCAGV